MLSIERFAAIRANVERGGELDRVLEESGLLRTEWSRLEKHWQGELAREIAAGGRALSERYIAAFFGSGGPAKRPDSPAPREGTAPKALFVPTYLAGRAQPVQPAQAARPPPPVIPAQPPKVAAPPPVEVPAHIRLAEKAAPGSTVFAPDNDKPKQGVVSLPFVTKPTPGPMNATFVDDGTRQGVSPKLPFDGKREAPPPAQVVVRGEGTGTELMDEGEEAPMGGPTVPEGLPVLTVDQYAWMMARLKRTPAAEMGATLARLRLTEAARTQLQGAWKAHLDANPSLRASYVRAFAQALDGMTEASATPDPDATAATDARAIVDGIRAAAPFNPAAATAPPPRQRQAQSGDTEALSTMKQHAAAVSGLPMPLDRFVMLQASLAGRTDRDSVLRAQGIDPLRWPEVLRAYGEAMKRSPELMQLYEQMLASAAQRSRG